MLNTTNSNSEYLHNYIRKVAKQEQESVDISNVYTGTIEAAQSGIYTIVLNQSDNSSSVLAIPIVSGDVYDKDDSIYLLRANTTATVNYFIVGKVNAIQEAFFNLTELERFNPNESKADLSFGDNDFISISENINNIFDSINELGYFQLEVKIASKVEDDAKIIIYLNYVEDEGQYAAKFEFSSYEFIGQPGGDNYTLIQKKIFHLPSSIDIENIRIEKVGDFSVAAMNIVAGSLLEVSAAYQNNIIVQNDRNYFEKEMPDASNPLNTITLTSKVYYNNKPLVGDALQYYWFLKDDKAIDDESVDYLDIEGAGNGWRCLNAFTSATTADEQEIRLWDNKNNFIVLNKTNEFVNFSNFVNKVKCIVKYFDNFIESDLIDIYNYDYEQFSATLTTNVDPVIIINRDDEIQLECKITNNNSKSNLSDFIYKYEWHLGDTVLSNLKDGLIKVQDKSSTSLEEKDIQENVREMENDIEEYYCKVSIYHKNDVIDGEIIEGKQPISKEISNTIQVTSAAAATDIQEEVRYKYYIADNHSVTFKENTQASEDTELSEWSGDWDIYDSNVTKPTWTDGSFEAVFNDLNLFNNKDKTKEYFVYYTKRTVVRQGLKILRKEIGSFPQIARSVIYGNGGWKNYRVGNITNQLNTFNQLTNNGEDVGIYYSDIPELVLPQEELDWATTYYKKIVSSQGEISYQPVQLIATINFKEDLDYYIYNNEEKEYDLVSSEIVYDESTDYYKKIGDNEYQKLVINTQNFDITNIQRPEGVTDLYKNIDNKLFINATHIRSGTLEVKDTFYANIDTEEVKIAGFTVDKTVLSSNNETVGFSSDNEDVQSIAIWAGGEENNQHPFEVHHDGYIKAMKGDIGGFEIDTFSLSSHDNTVGFNSNSGEDKQNLAIWAGDIENENHPFEVQHDGAMRATKGQIGGFTITANTLTAGSGSSYVEFGTEAIKLGGDNSDADNTAPFSVTKEGYLTAESGSIGGFELTAEGIKSINSELQLNSDGTIIAESGSIGGFILAAEGIKSANSELQLNSDGTIIANNAEITGGSIGAFNITSDGLIGKNDQFIKLTSQLIHFPTQSMLNLADDVKIYAPNEDVSYIITTGKRNFEIKNEAGAGFRFARNKQDESAKVTCYFSNCKCSYRTVDSWYESVMGAIISYSRYQVDVEFDYQFKDASGTLVSCLSPQIFTLYFWAKMKSAASGYGNIGPESTTFIIETSDNGKTPKSGKVKLTAALDYTGMSGNHIPTNYKWGWTADSLTTVSNTSLDKQLLFVDANNTAIFSLGHILPEEGKQCVLGGQGKYEWENIYAKNAIITGSDRNIKNSINLMKNNTKYDVFFDSLLPVTYKFNSGTSNRVHTGFIAQDVEDGLLKSGLTTIDFAGICISQTEEKRYSLRYEEFISLCVDQIQKLKKRVADQEVKIIELENQIKEIKGDK